MMYEARLRDKYMTKCDKINDKGDKIIIFVTPRYANTAIFFILRNFYDRQIRNILYHNQTKDCLSWNLIHPE